MYHNLFFYRKVFLFNFFVSKFGPFQKGTVEGMVEYGGLGVFQAHGFQKGAGFGVLSTAVVDHVVPFERFEDP